MSFLGVVLYSPVRSADQSTVAAMLHLLKFKVFKDQGPRSTKLRLGEVVEVKVLRGRSGVSWSEHSLRYQYEIAQYYV